MWRTIKIFGRYSKATTTQISFSPDVLNDFFTPAFQPPTLDDFSFDDLPHAALTVTKVEVFVELKKLKRRS